MAEDQQVPRKSKRGLWIGLIVAILCIATAVFVYFTFLAKDSAAVSPKDMKSITLPSMTVNLADSDRNRYLRTTITLEYSSPKLEEELKLSMYKVKDGVLKVLRNSHASTFEDPQQTDAVKQAMLDEVNSRLQSGKLTALYFEELLVQ